jgi:hypothetical protein
VDVFFLEICLLLSIDIHKDYIHKDFYGEGVGGTRSIKYNAW